MFKTVKLDDREFNQVRKSRVSRKAFLEALKDLSVGRAMIVPELDMVASTTRQYVAMANKFFAHAGQKRRLVTRTGVEDGARVVKVICVDYVPEGEMESEQKR